MKRWQQATQEELKKYVPDPDGEIERLQEQLAIAIKALKDCNNDMKYWAVLTRRNQRILNVIKQALKEMESVK